MNADAWLRMQLEARRDEMRSAGDAAARAYRKGPLAGACQRLALAYEQAACCFADELAKLDEAERLARKEPT